jgi:hypothetical protein
VAADVIDGPGMLTWLAAYRSRLDEAPQVWGLHDYYDTTYFRTTGLEALLQAVPGTVWLTETGGIVELRTRDGGVSLPYDDRRARASVTLAFETARAYAARVKRLYLYQWQAEPGGRFDAGLLRSDGTPRPAFDVVRTQAAALSAAAAPAGGPAATASRPAASAPVVPGRVTIRASGRADVRVSCPAVPGSRCAGALWLEGAAFANGTLINGHTRGHVLRPLDRRFAVAAGGHATLRFRVPRAVLRHAFAQRLLALRMRSASADAPFAVRSRYRADAWQRPAVSARR